MNSLNPVILKSLTENNNIVTTAEVLSLGFSKQLLVNYVRSGLLERVRHGVYILPDSLHDEMYTLMLRSEYIIFSHETALFLNNLSDRTPCLHHITLPSNKAVSGSVRNECVPYYIKPKLHKLGLIERKTCFGNTVRCYDPERTVCDFLRTRNRCDEETVISAIKNYAAYGGKNLNRLGYYAGQLKVDAELKKYMEILL